MVARGRPTTAARRTSGSSPRASAARRSRSASSSPSGPGTRVDGVDAFARHLVVVRAARRRARRCDVLPLLDGADPFGDGPERPRHASSRATRCRPRRPSASTPEYDTRPSGSCRRRSSRRSAPSTSTLADGDADAAQAPGSSAAATTRSRFVSSRAVGDRARRRAGPRVDRAPPRPARWRRRAGGPAGLADAPRCSTATAPTRSSIDPVFSSARLSLLERGVVFAIAHVRGGGELGRSWYEAGRLEHKVTSFLDFVDVAHALVERGFTDAEHLAAMGGSAGGLLMGAAMNLDPRRLPRGRGRGPVRRRADDDARRVAPAHRRRVGGVGRPRPRPRRLPPAEVVVAVRQRGVATSPTARRGPTPSCSSSRASTTRGSSTGSRRSGSRSSVPRTPRTASCSRPTSARATRGRRGATTRGASARWSSRGWPSASGRPPSSPRGARAERMDDFRTVIEPFRIHAVEPHRALDARRARGWRARRRLQPVQPAREGRAHRPADRLGHRRDEPRPVGGAAARRRVLRGLALVVRVRGRGPGPLRLHPRDPHAPGSRRGEDPLHDARRPGQGRAEQHPLRHDAGEPRVRRAPRPSTS